jgi:hypothetical protein
MRTDGVFTVRELRIKWKHSQPLTLIPFGDIHWDSPAFSRDKWDEFLKRGRAAKNALFLGMGDYMDGYSTSEREVMYSGKLHESSRKRHEEEGRARIRSFAKELSFMKGRLIGLIGGNHFQAFPDGSTGDNYLAQLMGCPYLGACCALRVTLIDNGRHVSFDIFAHHGRGGGRTAAGRFNSVEQLASVCDADIYLMGDNHARGALPMNDRLRIMSHSRGGAYIRARRPWIGRTGSFLKAYEDGESSYVVDSALPPASLGWIEFDVRVRRSREPGQDALSIDIGSRQ